MASVQTLLKDRLTEFHRQHNEKYPTVCEAIADWTPRSTTSTKPCDSIIAKVKAHILEDQIACSKASALKKSDPLLTTAFQTLEALYYRLSDTDAIKPKKKASILCSLNRIITEYTDLCYDEESRSNMCAFITDILDAAMPGHKLLLENASYVDGRTSDEVRTCLEQLKDQLMTPVSITDDASDADAVAATRAASRALGIATSPSREPHCARETAAAVTPERLERTAVTIMTAA